jgi:N6-adenosine-specific RNA methylase IME4
MIPFHPLANIFPLLEGEAFSELVADVRAHGLREGIVLLEEQILDGRNRYRACLESKTLPLFVDYLGNDPLGFVISKNLHRRHLTESQRSMVAAKLAQLQLGANQHSEGLPIGRASELLNVGERSVARAREVQEHGAPELIQAVEAGRVKVSVAADIATQSPEQQREIVAREEREIMLAAKAIRERRGNERRARQREMLVRLSQHNAPLPERRFPILYGDPPWTYDFSATHCRSPQNHYPVMTLEEIYNLKIAELATPDAMLFLWVPAPLILKGGLVAEAWGFELATSAVWVKDKMGNGYYVRQQHELLLIARRGNPITPAPQNMSSSVIYAPRREHSRKPDEVYEIIERMYPDLPKIELFARNARKGWAVWGNEAPAAAPPPLAPGEMPPIPEFLRRSLSQERVP